MSLEVVSFLDQCRTPEDTILIIEAHLQKYGFRRVESELKIGNRYYICSNQQITSFVYNPSNQYSIVTCFNEGGNPKVILSNAYREIDQFYLIPISHSRGWEFREVFFGNIPGFTTSNEVIVSKSNEISLKNMSGRIHLYSPEKASYFNSEAVVSSNSQVGSYITLICQVEYPAIGTMSVFNFGDTSCSVSIPISDRSIYLYLSPTDTNRISKENTSLYFPLLGFGTSRTFLNLKTLRNVIELVRNFHRKSEQ